MRTKITLSILFLSAACATPSFGNYFHNPSANLNFNIGSAPSPTPRDIRDSRQPQVVQAASSDDNVAADDATKNTDKHAANNHPPLKADKEENVTTAQLAR
jgi:hypothetical protein